MIRLGILDFDTSHVVAFASRLNHAGVAENQWVDGAMVVAGCPGESALAPDRLAGYTAEAKKLGIPLVDKPADLLGKVDGVIVASLDGTVHLERAKPFLEAGLPVFIDKPFACSAAQARAIVALAARHKAPLFSSSSLRYAPEVLAARAELGPLEGAAAWGPGSLSGDNKRNPGLFHYGIHAAEMLYALLGPGCKRVTAVSQPGATAVTGEWADGRIGTVRAIRKGASGFGFSAWGAKAARSGAVSTDVIYRELLKRMVVFFRERKPPVDLAETVELMGFLEAANTSAANHGSVVMVDAP